MTKPRLLLVTGVKAEDVDTLFEGLLRLGVHEVDLVDHEGGEALAGLVPPDVDLSAAARVLRVRPSRLSLTSLEGADWDSVFSFGTKVLWFGPLRIETSILPSAPSSRASGLRLVTGRAFGSGLHESTALVVEALVAKRPNHTILDVGTGTGILALSALRLGAKAAVGVDTDDEALRIARANARRNDIPDDRFLLARPEALPPGPYGFVLANILPEELKRLAPWIIRQLAPGATLLLSGLRSHHAETVTRAYTHLGLRLLGKAARNEWTVLELSPSW